MKQYTEAQIRKSFINCSKGAASRINIPKDLLEAENPGIFLAWTDPKNPQAGHIGVETPGGLASIVLKKNTAKKNAAAQMCQLCNTLHPGSGVSFVSIQLKSGKDAYNTIGTYICADLNCTAYVLGKKKPEGIRQMDESLTIDQKIERTLSNVRALVQRVAEKR